LAHTLDGSVFFDQRLIIEKFEDSRWRRFAVVLLTRDVLSSSVKAEALGARAR
jgi:hypothetical protein